MKTLPQHIKSVETQLAINKWLKGFLVALSVILIASMFGVDGIFRTILTGAAAVIFPLWFGAIKPQRKEALQLIHQAAGNLEFSLELLDKPNPSLAERLQLDRIANRIPPNIRVFYLGLLPYFVGFLVVYGVFLALDRIQFDSPEPKTAVELALTENMQSIEEKKVLLENAQVQIQSPAYTGIGSKTQETLDIKAIRGSVLTWNLGFGAYEGLHVFLVNSSGEKLEFQAKDKQFQLREELVNSGIYSIQAERDSLLVYQSEFYTLESVEDKSPEIIPEEKETYRFFFPGNNPKIQLHAQISDDFKVQEVVIVATLVRGKGENVKFRETRFAVEKQPFSSKKATFTLDVSSLDFQPGDELYYYWAAVDNKAPEPNFSRTDTYFIKYYDENDDSGVELEGMAIQILPEYFRSQRQIIIDTEKLLAEKKSLTEQKFNSTSNEIGYDQKLLRLRYGQYLGEEFETAAVGVVVEPENDGDMLKGYQHLHDQEGEHLETVPVPAQTAEAGHDHGIESEEGSLESLMSEYIHSHDSAEENTYYEQSTRGALKAALEQMWQAELYMRIFEPEKSLPYQYKALELLKGVQQKSRVFVKRTGYDPPPIKEEEKRLSGELKDLEKQIQKEQAELNQQIEPLASEVLGLLSKNSLNASEKSSIQKLGELWTERMKNSQLEDWNLLLYLQQLEAEKLEPKGKDYLREKLYPLAKNYKSPTASYLGNEALKNAFRKNLK